jgi:hypothetical protein
LIARDRGSTGRQRWRDSPSLNATYKEELINRQSWKTTAEVEHATARWAVDALQNGEGVLTGKTASF